MWQAFFIATFGTLIWSFSAAAETPAIITFSFSAYVAGTTTSYSADLDKDVAVASPSEWRCKRQRIYHAPDGEQSGTFQCSNDGKTAVFVSATCGPKQLQPQHNTVDIVTDTTTMTLHADCVTREWVGF